MDITRLITEEENYFVQFDHTSLPRGGLTHNDAHELDKLVRELKRTDLKIADVGCWTGFSTCILGNIAEENRGKVWAIDWFKGSELTNLEFAGSYYNIKNINSSNINKFSFKKNIEIVDARSEDAVKQFEDNFFDVVFIDADHRYEHVKNDINRWLAKVKVGGILCGHDCEVAIPNGINDLMDVYRDYDTVKEIHLGVCKAVGELGGIKTRWLPKFNKQESLQSSIWYYEKK